MPAVIVQRKTGSTWTHIVRVEATTLDGAMETGLQYVPAAISDRMRAEFTKQRAWYEPTFGIVVDGADTWTMEKEYGDHADEP